MNYNEIINILHLCFKRGNSCILGNKIVNMRNVYSWIIRVLSLIAIYMLGRYFWQFAGNG